MPLSSAINQYCSRPAGEAPRTAYVRPWALAAPILILLICIPLLRPLRHPDPRLMSDDEQSRMATVQALVENHTLAIENTDFAETRDKIAVGSHLYSSQPPMFAALLSGPYWVMHRLGLNLGRDSAWAAFWLTLLGVTLPVALSAGLVYRMGRLFELRRPLRAGLGLAVVAGSGLLSYGTVLNAHAPAAALLLAATACLFHVTLIKAERTGVAWLALSGLCASLAACIDPPAAIFLVLLLPVAAALGWPRSKKLMGLGAYVVAAMLPIAVHAILVRPITGDLKPGVFHPELMADSTGGSWFGHRRHSSRLLALLKLTPAHAVNKSVADSEVDEDETPGFWPALARKSLRVLESLTGPHGIFSHFPVVLIGIIGVSMVMHRHWPMTTKIMAAATLAGAGVVIVVYAMIRQDVPESMFATPWFVVFLPLVLFWAGVWLRRPHHQAVWIAASVLLLFSVFASLIGATGPSPRDGFDRYSIVQAIENLRKAPPTAQLPPILADRRLDAD